MTGRLVGCFAVWLSGAASVGPPADATDDKDPTPLPDLDADPDAARPAPSPIDLRPRAEPSSVRGEPERSAEETESSVPAPRVEADNAPPLRVAFGLGPDAPGTAAEIEMVDRLEATLANTRRPKVQARRLAVGGTGARRECRRSDADLVIVVGYLPDRPAPVWLPYDCALDEALGVRAASAADSPDWIGVLWDEHEARVAQGAQERARGPNRRLRTALIATGATLGVGAAVALILVNALRPTSTVLKVQPE